MVKFSGLVLKSKCLFSGPRIFVHTIGEGEFLLRVPSATTRQMLLGRTCWNVAGFPMFVANWSPDFTPDEAPLTNAVIPVELRDVPYLLFNKESLSRLATAVGKPVLLAPETERKLNFKVAKLYVKVDLTKPLPRKIISGFSNGKESEIAVSYPWLPLRCDLCKKYGHSREKCRAQQGNASHRSRSKSPPKHGGRTRKSSRSSGVKLSTGTSSHHLINTPPEIEEGEFVPGKDPVSEEGVPVVKDLPPDIPEEKRNLDVGNVSNTTDPVPPLGEEACTNEEAVIEGSGEQSEYLKRETTFKQGGSDHNSRGRSVGSNQQSQAATEKPFILVTGRKSGRKAKPSK